MSERPKPPPMHVIEKGAFARGELDPVTREPLHPEQHPIACFIARLFAKPAPVKDDPRPMTDQERAEHWRRVTWPATRNYILDLSRY